MPIKFKDFDDDEREEFARGGRLYHDITPTVNACQREYINEDVDMHDQILVMATRRYKLHSTKGFSFFVTNYSSDRPPFNQVGRPGGSKSLETKRETLWVDG